MTPLSIYSPYDLQSSEGPNLSQFGYRFLAEGDSWFTIGSLNPAKNSNLLFEMAFESSACAINCAYPGDRLQRMANMTTDPIFVRQLARRTGRAWDGLLLSAGGNDLIAALSARGDGLSRDKRLLLDRTEWGAPELGPQRYVSDEGWATFGTYFRKNLQWMLALRDSGPSRDAPVFMHGYAMPVPRPSGAGLGAGPWLLPSLQAYQIPASDYIDLAAFLIGRLADLIRGCAADPRAFPNLHFFDSTQVPLVPAQLGSTGSDGDWVNEIHLTWAGYEKIARPWCAAIEATLRAR